MKIINTPPPVIPSRRFAVIVPRGGLVPGNANPQAGSTSTSPQPSEVSSTSSAASTVVSSTYSEVKASNASIGARGDKDIDWHHPYPTNDPILLPIGTTVTTNASTGDDTVTFVRDRAEEDEALRRMSGMRRLLDRLARVNTTTATIDVDGVHNVHLDLLANAEAVYDALSRMRDDGDKNEGALKSLQRKVEGVTKGSLALSKHQSDREGRLRRELLERAVSGRNHKMQAERWRHKCEGLEFEMEEKERILLFLEEEGEARGDALVESIHAHPSTKQAEGLLKADNESLMALNGELEKKMANLADSNEELRRITKQEKDDFERKIRQLQSDNESIEEEVQCWKERHDAMESLNGVNTKEIERLASENDRLAAENERLQAAEAEAASATPSLEVLNTIFEVDEARLSELEAEYGTRIGALQFEIDDLVELNDNLVDKLGQLADENGRLLDKCERLEDGGRPDAADMRILERMSTITRTDRQSFVERLSVAEDILTRVNTPMTNSEYKEVLVVIQDMEAENEDLHKAMEDALQLASSMNERMASFAKTRSANVEEIRGLKVKLARTKEELGEALRAKERLVLALDTLRKDHELLHQEMKVAQGKAKVAEQSSKPIDPENWEEMIDLLLKSLEGRKGLDDEMPSPDREGLVEANGTAKLVEDQGETASEYHEEEYPRTYYVDDIASCKSEETRECCSNPALRQKGCGSGPWCEKRGRLLSRAKGGLDVFRVEAKSEETAGEHHEEEYPRTYYVDDIASCKSEETRECGRLLVPRNVAAYNELSRIESSTPANSSMCCNRAGILESVAMAVEAEWEAAIRMRNRKKQ